MITIVGGVPEPGGGVTNFIYRLALHFPSREMRILDLYPSSIKRLVPGVELRVRPRSFARGMAWLWWQLARDCGETVYFNFSSPRFLLLAGLFPKHARTRWLLTLHHGRLGSGGLLSRFLTRWSLGRFDRIGFLGEAQRDFFLQNGVAPARMQEIVTYLPYLSTPEDIPDDEVMARFTAFRARYEAVMVASGYPGRLYRYDWSLAYVRENSAGERVGLVLCVYGEDREALLPELREATRDMENVLLFEGLDAATFHAVLQRCDVYVRPTAVDSYGVAVAEAIDVGVAVVASDACKRKSGAHIFAKEDKQAYFELLDKAVAKGLSCGRASDGDSMERIRTFLWN